MKKLILILAFIFISTTCFAANTCSGVAISGGAMGGGAAVAYTLNCTGDTTCLQSDGSTDANCDLSCNDFEGGASCYTGYDANCEQTFSSLSCAGAGDSIDFTTTPDSPTSGARCTYGTNAVQFAITNSGRTCVVYKTVSATTVVYDQYYLNVISDTFANTTKTYTSGVRNSSAAIVYELGVGQSSDANRFYLQYYKNDNTTATVWGSSTVWANQTWYRIRVTSSKADGTITVYINDTQEFAISDMCKTGDGGCTARNQERIYRGSASTSGSAATFQIDNSRTDNDTEPSPCN